MTETLRFNPLKPNRVLNGSLGSPYVEPKGPVHITSGSAGCQERHDEFKQVIKFEK